MISPELEKMADSNAQLEASKSHVSIVSESSSDVIEGTPTSRSPSIGEGEGEEGGRGRKCLVVQL